MMENRKTVTCQEMKDIERRAAEGGLSYYQMMENAGTAAYSFIAKSQQLQAKKVLIFCGKGNNGGDGFVVARKLSLEGAIVTVLMVEGQPKTEDSIKNWKICLDMRIPIIEDLADYKEEADIIVDAVYGTGFHGVLKDRVRRCTKYINKSKAKVYALDIPSGLNGDTGEADEDAVVADYTIAFHSFKPVHIIEEAQKYCGENVCVDIGIEDE
ncbi:MAG: NAD(P)H-hydrate epimerase [Clostridiales bacterium]|jgi:hydroxyethylthiazole kinase-like uncharacterized protein yjeF|nr:NAD(P)H-hydrate epimerase [Clostridiales bacterium]